MSISRQNLSIVIVTLKSENVIYQCIKSINKDIPIIVVENSSNSKFKEDLEKAGLIFSGMSPDNNLIEMIEVKDHPFFVASQFHPEFKSRPWEPAPMFNYFIEAATNHEKINKNSDKVQKVKD